MDLDIPARDVVRIPTKRAPTALGDRGSFILILEDSGRDYLTPQVDTVAYGVCPWRTWIATSRSRSRPSTKSWAV